MLSHPDAQRLVRMMKGQTNNPLLWRHLPTTAAAVAVAEGCVAPRILAHRTQPPLVHSAVLTEPRSVGSRDAERTWKLAEWPLSC